MCRCKVTGPNVEVYFSLNGYKCNLHFWHAQNEFPFFVHTCIDIQFERSRVQQYDPFRHWFHHGLYDVGLHVPGNILLHSLSLYCFQTSPLGFEKEQLSIVPIRIFSFARRYANFPYIVFDRRHNFTSGHPFPHQKKKQTNNKDK